MSRNSAFIHVIIVLVVVCFFNLQNCSGPQNLGAPGLCPAQLTGCDAIECAPRDVSESLQRITHMKIHKRFITGFMPSLFKTILLYA